MYSVNDVRRTMYSVNDVRRTPYTIRRTLYTKYAVHYILYSVQYKKVRFTQQSKLNSLHVRSLLYTVHRVQFTVYLVCSSL